VKLDWIGISDRFHIGQLALAIDPSNVKKVTLHLGAAGGSNLTPTGDARGLLADLADGWVLPDPLTRTALPLSANERAARGPDGADRSVWSVRFVLQRAALS